MSKIEVNQISSQCGSTLTVGQSGDTVTLASGASQTGFGRTGTVDWDTTAKTAAFTAVSGNGYFCNTTSSAFTVNLPAGSAGAIVSLADYAATWQTNNLTVSPNGSEKIGSQNENAILSTKGQSVTFVYVDSTQGWINTMDSTSNVRGLPPFVAATGGTETTCGDFKIHTFTGPGTFTVTSAGSPVGSETVDYLVVAGGGGVGIGGGGGGGAGGYRESSGAASGCYTASPLGACVSALPVSVQGYPIIVGSGGAGVTVPAPATPGGSQGGVSTFSTITSAGGGGSSSQNKPGHPTAIGDGGSGAGSGANNSINFGGNTPPVSPPQGNNGGDNVSGIGGGGGGGATAVGTSATPSSTGVGGNGATSSINASPVTRAGGGGGGSDTAPVPGGSGGSGGGGQGGNRPDTNSTNGTTNTGGGAGGVGEQAPVGTQGNGGSGIVIIRYKFQ